MVSRVKPIFLRVDPRMTTPGRLAVPGGEVAFFSSPSPDHAQHNEDAAAVFLTAAGLVLAVADGAGGTARGDRAAAIAIETLERAFAHSELEDNLRSLALDAIEKANASILAEIPGALATIGLFVIKGGAARAISVGDSVCAVIGGRGKVKYKSIAHGPTGFAEEAGLLEQGDAMTHDERHLVSNMLGFTGVRIEVGVPLVLAPRDTLLVACDGLYDNLDAAEISALVRKRPLTAAVEALARAAGARMTSGGSPSHPDDLTILAYRMESSVKPRL